SSRDRLRPGAEGRMIPGHRSVATRSRRQIMTPFCARSQRSTSATSHIPAVLALFLCALSILSPALARASAPPHVKLAVQKYELPNGLDVILCKNDRLPTVGVNV